MTRILFLLLLIVVVLAPAPLGANREWAWLTVALALAAIGLGWALLAAFRRREARRDLGVGPLILFLAVCAWAALQASTLLPQSWIHPLWNVAGGALGEMPDGRLSLPPDDGWMSLLRWMSYGLAFFLAFQWCREPRRARTAFLWLAGAGLAYGVYGLGVFWSGTDRFLWFWELPYQPAVRATFANRNNFATWMGLCLLCGMALFYQRAAVRRNPVYRLPADRSQRIEEFLHETWKPLAVLIVMTAALVLSHSRGGFVATFTGVIVLLLGLNHRQRIERGRSRLVLASTLLAVIASFWITSEILLQRIDRSTADMQSRLDTYTLAADGIEDNPVLGFGYGTFSDSFRLYRDESLQAHFRRTHNTYMENAFELGWPVAAAQFACIAWLALICLGGLRRRGRDWVYPATGLAATALVAVHSLVDFSLQIPAVALTYAVIMGAACAQSRSSRR